MSAGNIPIRVAFPFPRIQLQPVTKVKKRTGKDASVKLSHETRHLRIDVQEPNPMVSLTQRACQTPDDSQARRAADDLICKHAESATRRYYTPVNHQHLSMF